MGITSQEAVILKHLREHGSISQREAYEQYGIMRLAARIARLRGYGNTISAVMEYGENRFGQDVRYARYYLEEA